MTETKKNALTSIEPQDVKIPQRQSPGIGDKNQHKGEIEWKTVRVLLAKDQLTTTRVKTIRQYERVFEGMLTGSSETRAQPQSNRYKLQKMASC